MQLRQIAIVASLVLTGCSPGDTGHSSDDLVQPQVAAAPPVSLNPGEKFLSIPTDSKATYVVIGISGEWPDRQIITKRVGPSGTSFSTRLYNCAEQTVKYIGTGDTFAEMEASAPDPNMAPIVSQSIAHYVGQAACER